MSRSTRFVGHADYEGDWPPPAEQVWTMTGSIGSGAQAVGPDGEPENVILVRLSLGKLNGDDLEVTVALDQDMTVGLLVGLIGSGQQMWGRADMMAAIGAALGLPPGTVAAVSAAAVKLRPPPAPPMDVS